MHFLSLNNSLKQQGKLVVSYAMKQAFHVLQLPVLELAEWLKAEIDQNYVLEYEGDHHDESEEASLDFSREKEMDFERSSFEVLEDLDETFQGGAYEEKDWAEQINDRAKQSYQESLVTYKTSLFEHLMQQAKQTFNTDKEMQLAEILIGNLDERGFLVTPLESLADDKIKLKEVLKQIQTFDPPGVGARSLQESLLIQLKLKGKEKSLSFALIEKHFDELLGNRIPVLQKKAKCSLDKLHQAIANEIQRLDIHPGYRFLSEPVQPVTSDVIVKKIDDEWQVEINTDPLPHFKISCLYENLDQFPAEEKSFIRSYLAAGKWLRRTINRRHQTLKAISQYIIKKQMSYLNGETNALIPMTMQEVAHHLKLHESTIARAVSHKYLSFPQGTYSLRSFFTQALMDKEGHQISNHTIKQLLKKLVENEDKANPLSDQDLSSQINHHGMPCARRTVAKYRKSLNIAPAAYRRRWH